MRPELWRALSWLFTGIVLFATMDAAAKWLSRSYPIAAAVWVRYLVPTVLVGGYLWRTRGWKFAATRNPRVQALRGVTLVASTLCFWTALYHLPLVEAATVSFIGPTIVVVFSSLLLRERPRRAHWWALAIGFAGVVIALRPGFSQPGIGALAALASATLYSLYLVLTRKLTGEEDALALLFHANAIGALVLSALAPMTAQWPSGWAQWLLLPMLGVFGSLGHWCMIRAYEHADAATLAPFMYVQLLIATFYGWLFFDNLPDGFTLLGMLCILGSGLFVLYETRQPTRRAADEGDVAAPE
ncbi:MAG: DMT family transporter [Burkholderiales bacterium]|nr:DMT family transporter [Burkholderiales bacterium]